MDLHATDLPFDLQHQRERLWQCLADAAAAGAAAPTEVAVLLGQLMSIERFWAWPGRAVLARMEQCLTDGRWHALAQLAGNVRAALRSGSHRTCTSPLASGEQAALVQLDRPVLCEDRPLPGAVSGAAAGCPRFEVLVVHPAAQHWAPVYRERLAACRSDRDAFVYDLVFVDSAEDALTAAQANTDLQAVVYLPGMAQHLCRALRDLRPALDHVLLSDLAPQASETTETADDESFTPFTQVLSLMSDRVFESLHAALTDGVRRRQVAPFFDALQAYSRQPRAVFHALPLARGASVKDSPWAHDLLDFYGDNLFLAENSSTQGGMDSLLEPTGAIAQAQQRAAEAFGADATWFVTNGTSTANQIVNQAWLQPGDIVLVGADCHKSVPYSAMQAGASVVFLETRPLAAHDLQGGVPLARIKAAMLDLKRQGQLHRLRQITLTNSTFDGLVCHAERYMLEILAIKPDVVFHWDEAWFAFAQFHPLYQRRTAMSAAARIRRRLRSAEYCAFHAAWAAAFAADPDPAKWQRTLHPDPDRVRVRVCATQSTHKTLSAFRQGSMIHIADDDFDAERFMEAFRMHTSTSPNYQIIASLDVARRQAALEGCQRVREALRLAVELRQRIAGSAALQPWFQVLGERELVPDGPPLPDAAPGDTLLGALAQQWGERALVVDPTRITLDIRRTGLDGPGLRQRLMTHYDIQVNKTSRHTVLLLVNIGATQAGIDHLLQALHDLAGRFQAQSHLVAVPAAPALATQRRFHPAFLPWGDAEFAACDLRLAHTQGRPAAHVAWLPLCDDTAERLRRGERWVAAGFITPYPPGYPVVVPGQILTAEIVRFLQQVKVKEIHGLDSARGLRVFRPDHLAHLLRQQSPNATRTLLPTRPALADQALSAAA